MNKEKQSKHSKPIPVIRHTVTSYKRLMKANPLLKYEAEGINIDDILASASTNQNPKPESKPKPLLKRAQSVRIPPVSKLSTFVNGNKNTCQYTNKPKAVDTKNLQHKTGASKLGEKVTNTINIAKTSKNNCVHKNIEGKTQAATNQNVKKRVRRSLSQGHIQSKKGHEFDPSVAYSKHDVSRSVENFQELDKEIKKIFTPIRENRNSFVFRTPSTYDRRSIIPFSSTPRETSIQERLNFWLQKRGKSLSNFHHLRCFGLSHANNPLDEANKENHEVADCSSYEELRIKIPQVTTNDKTDTLTALEIEKLAKDALNDLQQLVAEGYPKQHCDSWLDLIKNKCKAIAETPAYWECRAAIEQSVGNISNAVDCYKNAIIQGAQIEAVDESLNNLLQKFSLLDINTGTEKNSKREKIMQDARNIFKSSIIQFAVQQRKLKNKSNDGQDKKNLIVTPVRRSTRLSRSRFTSTPGLQMFSSMKDIENDDVDFRNNGALI